MLDYHAPPQFHACCTFVNSAVTNSSEWSRPARTLVFCGAPRLKHWVVSLPALVFPQCQHFKSQVCAALRVEVNSGCRRGKIAFTTPQAKLPLAQLTLGSGSNLRLPTNPFLSVLSGRTPGRSWFPFGGNINLFRKCQETTAFGLPPCTAHCVLCLSGRVASLLRSPRPLPGSLRDYQHLMGGGVTESSVD